MRFDLYDRTAIAYHGTSRPFALRLVQRTAGFVGSGMAGDWLGRGVYFWEFAPRQAWRWARERHGAEAAVVASLIRLGNCLDLLDPPVVQELVTYHDEYVQRRQRVGKPVPVNVRADKRLDCAVLEYAYESYERRRGVVVDTCRGVYVPPEGRYRAWPSSWLNREAHIQLCVRNPKCILGSWLVPLPIEG